MEGKQAAQKAAAVGYRVEMLRSARCGAATQISAVLDDRPVNRIPRLPDFFSLLPQQADNYFRDRPEHLRQGMRKLDVPQDVPF